MGKKAEIAKAPETKGNNQVSKAQKSNFSQSQSINSPIDQTLFLQRFIGNQAVQSLFESHIVQAKLEIGQPGDIYEQEADRVAELVMRMPEPHLQRQVEFEKELVQTKQAGGKTLQTGHSLKAGIRSLRGGGGRPLPARVRSFFEPRFGCDFSQVRVHTDAKAGKSAQAVNALAYTVGRDVVFGAGQYAPGTSQGQRLLAHELAHVVQQRGVTAPAARVRTGNVKQKERKDARESVGGVEMPHQGHTKWTQIQQPMLPHLRTEPRLQRTPNAVEYREPSGGIGPGDVETPPIIGPVAGAYVTLFVYSSTGNHGDLREFYEKEQLSSTFDHTGCFSSTRSLSPLPSDWKDAFGVYRDNHGYPLEYIINAVDLHCDDSSGYASGSVSLHQLSIYKPRDEEDEGVYAQVIPASGFRLTFSVTGFRGGIISLITRKEPERCSLTGNGVELGRRRFNADPGRGGLNPTEVRVR